METSETSSVSAVVGAALTRLLPKIQGGLPLQGQAKMLADSLLASRNGDSRGCYGADGILVCVYKENGWGLFPRKGLKMRKPKQGDETIPVSPLLPEGFNSRVWVVNDCRIPVVADRKLILFTFTTLSFSEIVGEERKQRDEISIWKAVLCQIFGLSPPS